MSINVKKYTKDQMAKMVEDAQEKSAALEAEVAELKNRIDAKNDALAKCVAEKNELRAQARDATGNAEYWHGRFNNAFNVTEVQRQRIKEDADALRRERVNVETMTNQRNAAIAESKDLRTKLADTEAALGRANACIATMEVERDQQTKDLFLWRSSAQNLHDDLLNAQERANYAEAHPWRNLWAWVKGEAARHE